MLVFAILMVPTALVWTAIVIVSNGMSDAPAQPFNGAWTIYAAWALTALFFLAWWIG